MIRNEDLDWDEYREELLAQIGSDQKMNEILLHAFYYDDYEEVKKRLEVLEQHSINAVLQWRRD
jgi:hypothetical protein